MKPNNPEPDVEALVAMLDGLMASGTQHINLEVGDETRVQTVNSTDCGRLGACAQPNFNPDADDAEQDSDAESDDDDF